MWEVRSFFKLLTLSLSSEGSFEFLCGYTSLLCLLFLQAGFLERSLHMNFPYENCNLGGI